MKRNTFVTVVFLEDRGTIKAGTEVSMDRPRAAHYLGLKVARLKTDEPVKPVAGPVTGETEAHQIAPEQPEKQVTKPSKPKKK